jgi:hypothetical protein
MAGKMDQQLHGFALQVDAASAAPQLIAAKIQLNIPG